MKLNRILPIFIVTIACIAGCSSGPSDSEMWPKSATVHKIQPKTIKPCYAQGCLQVRGAPLSKSEIGYKRQKWVGVFPAPRIPTGGIKYLTPRNLYSNLNNNNPQVRSDALYAIDTILSDESRKNEHPQIQGMLDDYIRNMASRNHNPAEYEIVTDIYKNHFPSQSERLNRPNWQGIPNNSFGGFGLEEKITQIEKAPAQKIVQEAVTENTFTKSETTETKSLEPSAIPEFDFTDPKETATIEKTELEIQMEKNESLRAQKIAEDFIIDKEITKTISAEELESWGCSQKICVSRLNESKNDAGALVRASKIVLNDPTQAITPRLHAICSMKCAAQADKKYEPEVVDYLAGYIRRRVPWIIPSDKEKAPPIKAVRPDVQASLFVVGGRDRMKELGQEISLIGSDLRGSDMSFANLYNVNLSFTNLASTNMEDAYGLLDWSKVYLATINDTTKIPQSISAGFVVVKKPYIPLQPAGSYTVTTDDWIYWNAIPVK